MKLNLRQIRLIFFALSLTVLAAGGGYWFGTHQVKVSLDQKPQIGIERSLPLNRENLDLSLFWDVWDRLEASYLKKNSLDHKKMIYGAIRGLTASLEDPYTVFLPPSDNKQTKEDLNGSFEGVGIQLGYNQDNRLTVIAPLTGMPAEKAGVKAGDLILKIEDLDTVGVSLPEAVKLIRGVGGTAIELTLIHQDEKDPYVVSIIRETIIVPTVELKFENEVAHLRLFKFGDRTANEWHEAVNQILDKQPQGLVLDLRNNPGGYLTASVFISSEFLNSGEVVVQQEGSNENKETFSVNRQGKLLQIPLVVLVNQGSASASEIVAGALQEKDRAEIVGQKTFGKGTIQEAQDLASGSGLHVTIARWLLPSGESIDKTGIQPDHEVEDDLETEVDEQLEKAIEVLTTKE